LVSSGGHPSIAADAGGWPRLLDTKVVLDVANARDALDAVFGSTLSLATVDSARERHLAVRDVNFDFGGVHHWIIRQPVADILADSVV
jgi:hypothetical protein